MTTADGEKPKLLQQATACRGALDRFIADVIEDHIREWIMRAKTGRSPARLLAGASMQSLEQCLSDRVPFPFRRPAHVWETRIQQPESNMSASHIPIQQPVTGREELGDLTRPEQALAQFYKALNSRDLALMEQNWDGSDAAAMDNPLGGISRGWSAIRQIYQRLFTTPMTYSFEFWDYTLHRNGEVFWVVGRERGRLDLDGTTLELAIRTSRLFHRVDRQWRQIHHHGSIDDPGMLARYQAAVVRR